MQSDFICIFVYLDDLEFANDCHQAFIRGQQALDKFLWNETARHYNAYTQYTPGDPYKPSTDGYTDIHGRTNTGYGTGEALPDTPGAIMTDTFYAQVCSNSTC